MRITRYLGAFLAAGLLTQAAVAADLPIKAPPAPEAAPSWAGWYTGIEGGWGTAQFSQTNLRSGVSEGYFSQDGGLIGATLGYNWQVANWLLGIETDLAWANIHGLETVCGPRRNQVCRTEIDAFGTVRGRVGATVLKNTVLYVAGGLAYADVHAYKDATAITGGYGWKEGWTGGVGFETMFAPHWSAKLEYLYANFSGYAATYVIVSNNNAVAADERNLHMVRGGVNWHF